MSKEKQVKIDSFMERQSQYQKRKNKNLKKLTKETILKERNTETPSNNLGSKVSIAKKTPKRAMSSSSKKQRHNTSAHGGARQTITYDSFEGMKDGIANKMHCDPHGTSSALALQTINFPMGSGASSLHQ